MWDLRRVLKRVPGSFEVVRLFREPKRELARWRAFRQFAPTVHPLAGVRTPQTALRRVLVVDLWGDWPAVCKQQLPFFKALQLVGATPIILTTRGAWTNRYYRAAGVDQFMFFDEVITQREEHRIVAHALMEDCRTLRELRALTFHGVYVGKHACSSYIRKTRCCALNLGDARTRSVMVSYIRQSIATVLAAEEICDRLVPTHALFLERGYTPYGEFFDVALARGVPAVQMCSSFRPDALTLKRYTPACRDRHPGSLSESTWSLVRSGPWDARYAAAPRRELERCYRSGEWWAEVGTQFLAKVFDPSAVRRSLDLDIQKKTAVIFPHLFWDATFFWGEDLFANYREWFIETVRAAAANPHLNWIIKLHPANVVKLRRDKFMGEIDERSAIREAVGVLPGHLRVIDPETPIATLALHSIMDYCLTVRGTIGIEAATFGIPVLTAGTGHYDRKGFTVDSCSREEYLGKLAMLQEIPPLTEAQQALAERFAFGAFVLRPFQLESIQNRYRRDVVATQEVEITVRTPEDLARADDLQRFTRWFLETDDEDYIDERRIPVIVSATGARSTAALLV